MCHCQASRWLVGFPADPLLCGDADGLGSCHELELPLVASQQVVCPPSVTVCGCFSVAAPQKGAPGGGGVRISPTRCVSSMLICHPLNLYCSSIGSISHIDGTLVLLGLGSSSQTNKKKEKKKNKGNSDDF